MAGLCEGTNYDEEIAFLESMFGGTVTSAVIKTVIESCGGNVHLAADAIMNFTNEMSITQSEEPGSKINIKSPVQAHSKQDVAKSPSPQPSTSATQHHTASNRTGPLSTVNGLAVPSSQAFHNSGAIPKKPPYSKPQTPRYMVHAWPDQVKQILQYHIEGARTLVIMRGPSGCGKTYLAKQIVDYTVGPSSPQAYTWHIFSSDNYFMRGGHYVYNREFLENAHLTNRGQVFEAANRGVSPIIVDNTNTELWEMETYIRDAVNNGYIIVFLEPNTTWARNVQELTTRNVHGVPQESIRRMLNRYERNITPETALARLNLSYPPNMRPPLNRSFPPLPSPGTPPPSPRRVNPNNDNRALIVSKKNTGNEIEKKMNENKKSSNYTNETNNNNEIKRSAENENTATDDDSFSNEEHEIKLKKILEAQHKNEQFEKVEQEWDNGKSWDATTETINNSSQSIASNPKPPRRVEKKTVEAEKIIKPSSICDDWTKISMFMPPWQNAPSTNTITEVNAPAQVDHSDVGTSYEVGDIIDPTLKVILGTPRDINEGIPEKSKPKIPMTVMLDKSTSTYEDDILFKKEPCKNKDIHFKQLRRMFKSVPRDVLYDTFEYCHFDVNWAINHVLDDCHESHSCLPTNNEDVSDSEDEEDPILDCNCLSGYNILPDVPVNVETSPPPEPMPPSPTPVSHKKAKRENKSSNNLLQLKRQIESNVTISDNHYSQHYLNLRKRRENNKDNHDGDSASNVDPENNISQPNVPKLESGTVENATLPLQEPKNNSLAFSGSPSNLSNVAGCNNELMDNIDSDAESDSNKSDNFEQTVPINLGPEFLAKLDEIFGRKDFHYPENIKPVVDLPMSILQQINAHWSLSVASQLQDGTEQSEAMIKQDEEFARQLVAKELEMAEAGNEPETPTLKEIMDMEIAYNIYNKQMSEWKNNEPQDMAAKLSREKLYNLFPEIDQKMLSELLMAHGYSFKSAVEDLMITTGQQSWLALDNGIEKFVMQKEMERKKKFVEDENKNLDSSEWPINAQYTEDMPVTLETVQHYRNEAEKSLSNRNQNFEKARHYFSRNSPMAASFYSEIAALHTRKYEQYSCLAAAYLMNYHLKNNPNHDMLDLHYLRVSEAMVNLDIFIDQIILRLRNNNIPYKETWIITGKGTHSIGGPRIKPAAKKRLKLREIKTTQINEGFFMALLLPTSKLTSEMRQEFT